jgi:uncharacterized membrane protein
VGDAGDVETVFGVALNPVFRAMGVCFFRAYVNGRVFYGFKGKKSIFKTLDGLG